MLFSKQLPKFLFLLLILLLAVNMSTISEGFEQFLSVAAVQPGMTGIGYTVFSGTRIEPFNVKVINVINREKEYGKLILVRLSGDNIEKNGGLSAGMSGSPVYINNKLIGAISYGFENADNYLAMITPIETMFGLYRSDNVQNNISYYSEKNALTTPVIIAGMASRNYQLVKNSLESGGIKTYFSPCVLTMEGITDVATSRSNTTIRPGSAIAALLVTGDYQVTAIGTVTTVDNNSFLAFGHSFINKGRVDYSAFEAEILQTVKSPVMSFKIGAPLRPIGRIVQDRQAGILGRFGERADLIEVRVGVRDLDRKRTSWSKFQVINDEVLYNSFIIAGVMDSIDKAIDRIGAGTAKVNVRISTNTQPAVISKSNLFFSRDIASNCIVDLRNILELLSNNEFAPVKINSVQVELEVWGKQESARIIKLTSETKTVKPGETVIVTAQMRSYRGDIVTTPFEIKLPENSRPGKISLNVSSGTKGTVEDDDKTAKKPVKPDYKVMNSLNEVIADYLKNAANNELVLDYNIVANENSNSKDLTKPVPLKSNTKYYIMGQADLTLEIVE